MTGFDPTEFLGTDPSPGVAAIVGAAAAGGDKPQGAEVRDVWAVEQESVATAATVAAPCELMLDKPFAQPLNRLFHEPGCARFAGDAWQRILLALHRFADLHAQECLSHGWSDRELFAVGVGALLSDEAPLTHAGAVRALRPPSAAFMVGRREVVEITPGWIKFVGDMQGNTLRLLREHNRINTSPRQFDLIWNVPLF